MSACVVFACYMPDESKAYVLEEIVEAVRRHLGDDVAVYCGVQHGSDPTTEERLAKLAPQADWHFERVRPEVAIDSDAGAFVAGLKLLHEANTTHSLCYFIHTKAITSGADDLRRELLGELLTSDRVLRRGVGSYGPRATITRSEDERAGMRSWLDRFAPGRALPVMPYFYTHTMWVARGRAVKDFLDHVDSAWFTTPVADYSDRYFAERDLPHFVDGFAGLRPSFGRLVGSHTTGWARPRQREWYRELLRWQARVVPARGRRLLR